MLQAGAFGRGTDVGPPAAGMAAAGRRVLLAEDGPINRTIARGLLERAGFQVCAVRDGAEAVEAVAAVAHGAPFDLVLMDLDMPVMDGFAAAAAIRGLGGACAALPIVSLAARADVARALAAGMTGHIGKPFRAATFAAEVVRHLCATAPAAVWNREVFGDLVRRLGPARAEPILGMFEARLLRARQALTGGRVSWAAIAAEAHDLIGCAGTLGFADLCAVGVETQRRIQAVSEEDGADTTGLAAGLVRAVERALVHVRQPVP